MANPHNPQSHFFVNITFQQLTTEKPIWLLGHEVDPSIVVVFGDSPWFFTINLEGPLKPSNP